MSPADRLLVVTGGPGSGKSTLLEALAAAGVATMPEAGRAVIRDQRAIGGSALPWVDRAAFAEQMLGHEMRSHREALALGRPVVLDRGVPDVVGYLRLEGLAVPDHVARAGEVFRYCRRVVLAPHWPAIYATDSERRQSPAVAEATCRAMAEAYAGFGYEIVELPRAAVPERVRLVRALLG